jgi:ubiquitin-conjugating enzyme E2 J1
MFTWHFTIRGPDDSEFEGGLYHGVIKLPTAYPLKPPSIMFLTVKINIIISAKWKI